MPLTTGCANDPLRAAAGWFDFTHSSTALGQQECKFQMDRVVDSPVAITLGDGVLEASAAAHATTHIHLLKLQIPQRVGEVIANDCLLAI